MKINLRVTKPGVFDFGLSQTCPSWRAMSIADSESPSGSRHPPASRSGSIFCSPLPEALPFYPPPCPQHEVECLQSAYHLSGGSGIVVLRAGGPLLKHLLAWLAWLGDRISRPIFHRFFLILGSQNDPDIETESMRDRFQTWLRKNHYLKRFSFDFSSTLVPAKPRKTVKKLFCLKVFRFSSIVLPSVFSLFLFRHHFLLPKPFTIIFKKNVKK